MEFDDTDSAAANPFADVTKDHAKNMKAIRDHVHRAASTTGSLIVAAAPKDDELDAMKFDEGEDEFELYDNDKSARLKTAKPEIQKSSAPNTTD